MPARRLHPRQGGQDPVDAVERCIGGDRGCQVASGDGGQEVQVVGHVRDLGVAGAAGDPAVVFDVEPIVDEAALVVAGRLEVLPGLVADAWPQLAVLHGRH